MLPERSDLSLDCSSRRHQLPRVLLLCVRGMVGERSQTKVHGNSNMMSSCFCNQRSPVGLPLLESSFTRELPVCVAVFPLVRRWRCLCFPAQGPHHPSKNSGLQPRRSGPGIWRRRRPHEHLVPAGKKPGHQTLQVESPAASH